MGHMGGGVQPVRERKEGRERREGNEERGERRVGFTCHVDATLALNGHFNTV